ncbi:MAG: iron-containing alcohol dehydrogenase [Actinomycetota bacterium]|jgi:alcohol dehydrogenase class IV|nr:iron-containing alcohol dehydrogenase [Actinomycetota bacterium]
MACCHTEIPEAGDTAFSVDTSAITYGPACLGEAGDIAASLGIGRIALITDATLVSTEHVARVVASLADADVDVALYDEARVEPTDESFKAAAKFAADANVDGFISVGGGSVIDTSKAANLYSTHPADFLAYVNAPIGRGKNPPGPIKPHIACPTTSGTGAECTGIAVFDFLEMRAKTGIVTKAIRPTKALIDPTCTETLPANVVASSAFDVLSHALESYTARPYTHRVAAGRPSLRPSSQGANPWSDLGCREALKLLGHFVVRAVHDASDTEARHQLMWASTLAGIAFGNAGCHAPHGMSYSVSGLVNDFRPTGYPQVDPIVPHGMSVIVNSPSVFRHTAECNPERHLESAGWLGADVIGADPRDAGSVLADRLVELMRATGLPNGLTGVGYTEADIPALTTGSFPQKRLLDNAPCEITESGLAELYRGALSYW